MLLNLHATVAGVHIGRIDSIFIAAAVIVALSGVYFGLAARRPARSDKSTVSAVTA